MMQIAIAKHVTRPQPSCHLLVFVLLKKPFAPSGLLLFREQRVSARGRSSQSTDVSSSFCRLSVTRKKWQGCPLFASELFPETSKAMHSRYGPQLPRTDGRDFTLYAIVSGGRLQSAGEGTASHNQPNFIAGRHV